jgi:hypothetical protein
MTAASVEMTAQSGSPVPNQRQQPLEEGSVDELASLRDFRVRILPRSAPGTIRSTCRDLCAV